MKILRNEEYDKLINDKTPTIEYYMNNPYQGRKIEKLEDYNIELEIKIDKKDKEIERLNNIIKHTDSWIDRTIKIIKQQPSEDDTWILERLNGIKQCLKGSDKE